MSLQHENLDLRFTGELQLSTEATEARRLLFDAYMQERTRDLLVYGNTMLSQRTIFKMLGIEPTDRPPIPGPIKVPFLVFRPEHAEVWPHWFTIGYLRDRFNGATVAFDDEGVRREGTITHFDFGFRTSNNHAGQLVIHDEENIYVWIHYFRTYTPSIGGSAVRGFNLDVIDWDSLLSQGRDRAATSPQTGRIDDRGDPVPADAPLASPRRGVRAASFR